MLRLQEFTYDEYRVLLDRMRRGRANLCFADFRKPVTERRFFLLRHDVDFTPAGALEMAAIEAKMDIRATYYFLLSGRFYNLLSGRFASAPRQIADLGHEVGLHYDLQMLETVDGQSPRELLHQQADILSRLSGRPVRSIAMHNPSLSGADPFRGDDCNDCNDCKKTFINAYDDAFTRQIAYFSDSCGAWRDQAHETLTGREEDIPPRLQLLIHPLLWGAEPGDRWRRLADWAAQQKNVLHEETRRIERIWREHPGVVEHDKRIRKQ